ncbi:hypothetical protein GEMRC1_006450 [Eukaryota sp. GEM-RC1]
MIPNQRHIVIPRTVLPPCSTVPDYRPPREVDVIDLEDDSPPPPPRPQPPHTTQIARYNQEAAAQNQVLVPPSRISSYASNLKRSSMGYGRGIHTGISPPHKIVREGNDEVIVISSDDDFC